MNRQQRRQAERSASWQRKMMRRIESNGITVETMREAEQKQYETGWNLGVESATYQIYAAVLMTMDEDYGMSEKDKLKELLLRIDKRVVESFDYREDALKVWEKYGIRLMPEEAFNRIGDDKD